MKSFFVFCLIFLLSFNASSQDIVLDFECDQKSRQIKKYTFSLSNSLNGDLAILIRENKKFHAYLFDETFKPKSQLDFESEKKNRFNELLGYTIKESEYSLIYSNSFKNKFFAQTVDFSNNTSELKEIKLEFEGEKYLKTISHNNNLYVLSSTRDNDLIIRLLNNDYEFETVKKHALELDEKQKLQSSSLSFLNFDLSSNKQTSNITKIDNRVPNSLETTSNDNKIFNDENNLYLTFDNNTESTLMYIINLSDFSLEKKKFIYPKGRVDDYKNYNSYYLDGFLFQIASSNKEMTFVIRNLEGALLNLFYFDKDTAIDIKNTEIVQEKEVFLPFDGERSFEETSKFLRKISSGKLGLSVYKKADGYHLTIGGVKEFKGSGLGAGPMTSTTLGTNSRGQVIPITTFNPTYSGYSSYSTTKSIYFNTKLNFDFNYIKEEVSTTVFEKIEEYKEGLKYISAEDVFFHNDELLFGYFNMKAGRYKLVKF